MKAFYSLAFPYRSSTGEGLTLPCLRLKVGSIQTEKTAGIMQPSERAASAFVEEMALISMIICKHSITINTQPCLQLVPLVQELTAYITVIIFLQTILL